MTVAALAVAFGFTSAGEARADVITFTDSAAFFAALGAAPRATEGYNTSVGSTIPNGGSFGGFTYSFASPVPPANGYGPNDVPGLGRISNTYNGFGAGVLAATRPSLTDSDYGPGERVTVNFGGARNAVGIFFNADPAATQPGDLFIQTSAGTAFNGNNPVFGEGAASATLFFIGLISTDPFTSATFGSGNFPITGTRGFFTLDNLTTAQGVEVAIPAPATLLVFGGLAVVAGYRARRRQAV